MFWKNKKTCTYCLEGLVELGLEPGYGKSMHYYCSNENCLQKNKVQNYKNDKLQSVLSLKVLNHEKRKKAYLFNLKTQEQYWVTYE